MRKLIYICLLCLFAGIPSVPAGAVDLYLEHRIPGAGNDITALAFSPDGGKIAFGNKKGEVWLVAPGDGKPGLVAAATKKEITAIEFSPDGRYMAFAAKGKGVWLVDPAADTAKQLKDSKGRAGVLAFSDDGRYLAAAGDRKEIFVWEIPSGQLRSKLKGHDKGILTIAFDEKENRIVSVGKDRKMIIWDASSMKALRRYELEAETMTGSGMDVTAARVSGDGLFVAAAIDEHMMAKGGRGMIFKYHLAFFDVSKGILLKILEDANRKIENIALYPGNCFVAFDNSTLQTHSVALRNIETGSLDLSYSMSSDCEGLEFSPDGRWLAGVVDSEEGKGSDICLWSVDYEIPASGCFMGRIRLVSSGDPVLDRAGREPVIAAVLPFTAAGADEDLGRSAAHFLESELSGNRNLRLIERSRVDEIIKELKLQNSGLVERSTAVEMGRLLGAKLIITGNIDRAGSDLVISARVIDTATGEILGTRQVHCGQCGSGDIFDAIDMLGGVLVAE